MSTAQKSVASIQNSEQLQANIWGSILDEAKKACLIQPVMSSFFHCNVLSHKSFRSAISYYLASRLASSTLSAMSWQSVFLEAFDDEPVLAEQMLNDLLAHFNRDAACNEYLIPLLYYKGFHALESYRIGHWLWRQDRKMLALYLQHRISRIFDVDIHPAAQMGSGIMLDHATGIVIGETSVVEDDVSILHEVTLGGSGSNKRNRHPYIGRGVLLSAGATLLGDINIGVGAKVGAGSLVLSSVGDYLTVAGVPAKVVGSAPANMPSLEMHHNPEE
jgi:serine O-acetyltransferase